MTKPVTPLLAADALVELLDLPGRPIVLIRRRNPPHGWAIPGGFVDVGETLEHAAVREAKEEIGLDVTLSVLLGMYSRPQRDPRGHTVTAVYVAQAHGTPVANDDAESVGIFKLDELPQSFAFDHQMVLSDYAKFVRDGRVAPLRVE